MQWKGAKEWAVERTSIANKKAYADRHGSSLLSLADDYLTNTQAGYDLAIQDMSIKKRYAHVSQFLTYNSHPNLIVIKGMARIMGKS